MAAVAKMEKKYAAVKPLVEENPQAAMLILRQCHARRVTHLLRTHDPDVMRPAARRWDADLRHHFERLFDLGDIGDAAWARAQLPLRFGGAGLRSAENTMDSAFVACFASVIRNGLAGRVPMLQGVLEDLEGHAASDEALPTVLAVVRAHRRLQEAARDLEGRETPLDREPTKVPALQDMDALGRKGAQHELTRIVEGLRFAKLFRDADGDPFQQACWLSCTGPYATGAYHALPSWQGFKISKHAFLERLRMTLFLPLMGAALLPTRCPCCHSRIDQRGYHLIFCNHTSGTVLRHELLKEQLHAMIRSCGGRCVKVEPPVDDARGRRDGRPDYRRLDLDFWNFLHGATANYGIDVTVVSPTKGLSRGRDGE